MQRNEWWVQVLRRRPGTDCPPLLFEWEKEFTISCRGWKKKLIFWTKGRAGRPGEGQRPHGANEGLAATVQEEPITPHSFFSLAALPCLCLSVCLSVCVSMELWFWVNYALWCCKCSHQECKVALADVKLLDKLSKVNMGGLTPLQSPHMIDGLLLL